MTRELFENQLSAEARSLVFLKQMAQSCLMIFLLFGLLSSYRAYYQVHSLELSSANQTLSSGGEIKTLTASYGRTTVDVSLELIQGGRVAMVARQQLPGNYFAFFDPRMQRAAQTVKLSPEILARFETGPATLRATALGRSQWMRTPPPLVRELNVEIQR